MSQAEELLDSLVEAYAAEYDNNSDPHIVIGADRVIVVPEELKRIAVQYDHNMRTVTFDCPRYYDGRDMSKMRVYITIEGPLGARSSYIADDVRVDDKNSSVMHFDWTIKRTITSLNGPLTFLVCIRKADNEGNEENHWNSELNSEMYISKGMEYDSDTIESEYPDVVTQLLDRMDIVETNASAEAMQGYADKWLNNNVDTVLNDIQVKGAETLESIPEDYTTTHKYAIEGACTKADAIIRTVEGNSISVADSSDDYVRGLRVFGKTTQVTTTGKNLFPALTSQTTNGIIMTVLDDGRIVLNGTVTDSTFSCVVPVNISNNTYVFSANNKQAIGSDATNSPYIALRTDTLDWAVSRSLTTTNVSHTFTIDENPITSILFAIPIGVTLNDFEVCFQIEIGSAPTSYEPYTGGKASPSPEYPQDLVSVENPTVSIYGKNLLKNVISVGTVCGVTRTLNPDGSITFKGTSTEMHGLGVNSAVKLVNGEYIASGGKPNILLTIWGRSIKTGEWVNMTSDRGDGCVFTADDTLYDQYLAQYQALANTTYDTVLYPMIRSASVTDTTYEPYKEHQSAVINRNLPAIPVTSGGNYTDENGQQWICDEVDFERGVYVQRIREIIVDGTRTVATDGVEHNPWRKYVWINDYPAKAEYGGLCNRLKHRGSYELIAGNSVSDAGFNMSPDYNVIYFNIGHWMTEDSIDAAVTALTEYPLTIKYVLKTPIEIPLTAEELTSFAALRTNYPNTTVLSDSNVKMELKYNADTQLYVDNKIADSSSSTPGGNTEHYPDWSHLKWYVMGDSLTAPEGRNHTDKFYYEYIQEKTGIQLIVDGIGGTGYGAGVSNSQSFLDRVKNIPDDVDVVTIFGSGNDIRYAEGANLEIYDTLSWIAFNRPGMRVIVVPPAPWKGYLKREDPWKAYCDRLQVCALACDFRYLSDMWECPPFNPNFEGHMEKFFTKCSEGIHPNELGHEALAPYLYNALLQELALKV